MDVLLIRHAAAVDAGSVPGGDAARPLSEFGRSQFTAMATWLSERGVRPEAIIHSPRLRAVQTAGILAAATGLSSTQMAAEFWLGEGMPLAETLSLLRREGGRQFAIVGHEPDMSRTTVALIGGGQLVFRPGTIACIGFEGLIEAGCGRLKWLMSPELFSESLSRL